MPLTVAELSIYIIEMVVFAPTRLRLRARARVGSPSCVRKDTAGTNEY